MKNYVIYKVTNLVNQKIYIGKTYDFEKRKREHLYDIGDDIPFHRALKKYGLENFSWEIIDNANSDEELREKEIYWIKKLNSCIHFENSNGYNITIGGEGGVSWNSRPVIQFDRNGNFLKEYISCSNADTECKLYRGASQTGCYTKGLSAGFLWRYKDEWNGDKLEPYKRFSSRTKSVMQFDMYGDYVDTYVSLSQASEKTGSSRTGISACLSNKSKTCNGFVWIYSEDYDCNKSYKPEGFRNCGNGIVQLDDNYNLINKFVNCTEAALFIGKEKKSHKHIFKLLTLNKRGYGYYWRKYDDYIKYQQGDTEISYLFKSK